MIVQALIILRDLRPGFLVAVLRIQAIAITALIVLMAVVAVVAVAGPQILFNRSLMSRNNKIHQLFERQKGKCGLCGKAMSWDDKSPHYATIDHIFPRSRKGGNTAKNLQAACRKCNQDKAATIPITHLKW